jgi:hypothetical protein
MSALWVSLPRTWALVDVQAAANVVISFLSALAIWTFSRVSWARVAATVQTRNISVVSLFNISSLGDVVDIFQFLGWKAVRRPHGHWTVAQSIVIAFFTLAGVLSGPVARSALQVGTEVRVVWLGIH